MNLKKNDTVLVIKGRDRGKQARVTQAFPKDRKVIVEGVYVVQRHTKASANVRQAGIVQKELPIHTANLMLICTHCSRPVRVDKKYLADGSKVRVCNKCEEVIE